MMYFSGGQKRNVATPFNLRPFQEGYGELQGNHRYRLISTTGLWRANYCQVGYLTYGLLLPTQVYVPPVWWMFKCRIFLHREGELFQ
jgi:hypothetical protein